ncbi:DUF4913 domain-containing protein [Nocardia sp. CA-135953]|uniref:DUF4913 domain-containing protein n=1 Tax=Nocardia sp. CA-135953 TaxID=3239978 RepID=UPI003D997F18
MTTPAQNKYPTHSTWFESWLVPQIARKLSSGNREGTFTFCAQWWLHTEVSCRMAFLHSAWEASRLSKDGSAMSAWFLHHLDPHLRVVMDAASGPMWRCTPDRHVAIPTLPFQTVPDGSFPPTPTTSVADAHYRFHYLWFEDWLAPRVARKLSSGNREGTSTFCAQWWLHTEVACRMAFLHSAWEASRLSKDGSAMSAWFLHHLDPHLRVMMDAASGPMWRCTPDRHVAIPTLPARRIPLGWFATPHLPTDTGFGPDFRNRRSA